MTYNPLNLPSNDDILQIVKIEGKKRLSDEYIEKCTLVKDEVNGWLRITSEMQTQIVTDYLINKYGKTSDMSIDIGVNMLRNAQYLYPDNPDVQNLVYVKNNKANQGRFKAGDKLEDMMIWNIEGKQENSLFNLLSSDKTNIIFAASHT